MRSNAFAAVAVSIGFVIMFPIRVGAIVPTSATKDFLTAAPSEPRRAVITGDRIGALYGTVLASDSDTETTTDDFVADFIDTNADAFGVDEVDLEYVSKLNIRDDKFTVYTYRQMIEELPVHGGEVKILVLLGATEKISYVGIHLSQLPAAALPSENEITAQDALDIVDESAAYGHLTGFQDDSEAVKVIYEMIDGSLHRAWRFRGWDEDEAYFFPDSLLDSGP